MTPKVDDTGPAAGNEETPYADPPTCQVCSAVQEAVFSFFCQFQYQLAAPSEAQRLFLESLGLCPTHTWLLERLSSPRGRCESYPALLEDLADRLQILAGRPDVSQKVEALLVSSNGCLACRMKDQAERDVIGLLLQELKSTPDRRTDLCLRHLARVLKEVEEPTATALLRQHSQRFVHIANAMRRFAVKFDERRRGELSHEERSSPRESLEILAGARNLFFIQASE